VLRFFEGEKGVFGLGLFCKPAWTFRIEMRNIKV
jgi:hypothetical protein